MKTKRIAIMMLCLFMCVIMGGESILSALFIPTSAAVVTYSDVMDDLSSDGVFSASTYPALTYDEYANSTNVSYLSMIHIAEGEKGELFVYTYQPLNNVQDITATSILMYTGQSKVTPVKYKLRCVSAEGVFKKYLVEDFKIPTGTYRYYNIVEIERPFDVLLDQKISDETITNYKAHTVAQTWCCYYQNNKLVYEMVTLDVVEITPMLTDYLFFADGVRWGDLVGIESGCNAHYIAFNVDNYAVDRIYDASMEYYQRPFKTTHVQETGVLPSLGSLFGREDEHTATSYPTGSTYERIPKELSESDKVKYEGKGLWGATYKWNRIMTAQAFIENAEAQGVTFGENEKAALLQSQYVFAFTETPVTYTSFNTGSNPDSLIDWNSSTTTIIEGIDVREVDILRLHFESKGKTYNLGVVGDTTTGDNKPGGVADKLDTDNTDWFEKILFALTILALIVACSFLSGPIGSFCKILWTGIKFLFKMLFAILIFLLLLPFRLLRYLFDKDYRKRINRKLRF